MKKGFTLVELSIVLVIIGLLVGGILVAQSLIDSAKVQRMVRNLQQYNAAVNLFESNYKKSPGDSNLFTPRGNADGVLDNNYPSCSSGVDGREYVQVWAHLSQSGMLEGDFVAYDPTNCGGTHENWNNGWVGAPSSGRVINSGIAEDLVAPYLTESDLWASFTSGTGNPSGSPKTEIMLVTNNPKRFASMADQNESRALENKLDDGDLTTGRYTSSGAFVTGLHVLAWEPGE